MLNPRRENGDRSGIADLVRSLIEDLGRLFRSEIALAKAELTANASRLATPVAKIAAGALLGLAALLTLIGAFVAWLTPLVGAGWAAFIVALVVGGAGAALVMSGRTDLEKTKLDLPRSTASIRRSAETLKGN
jgi:hypothetical protein